MKKHFTIFVASLLGLAACLSKSSPAQDPVLFQGFYWDVPAGGIWWDTLAAKAGELSDAGVDMIWFPSPFKGSGGAFDMGYGIFDHYDAGNFDQKGTVETRFGSKTELLNAIQAYHNAGMSVICDIVMNHVFGGDAEYNPDVEDYIRTKSWYPVYPYDRYLYVFATAPAGRYFVQFTGNQYDHSQTPYDDRTGYYAIRPWFSNQSGQNADGQPFWYEWNIGDGDSGPFDAFEIDLPGRVMEGNVSTVGDVDEYYLDHTGGWLEFKIWSTDLGGTRDFIIPQLWYDPDTLQSGDDYDVTSSLKIYSYTRINPASGQFSKNYQMYHPTSLGHDDIAETYHYPYFGNDLCLAYSATLDSLKDWGRWLTDSLGFDGYRFDLAKGLEPFYLAQWLNQPSMTDRYYVAEHWSSATEIKTWVDQVNSFSSSTQPMTAFDFPLFYELQKFCDDPNYDARNLHTAGLYFQWNSGYNVTTFVHNHDVFRPYTSAHNPIVNNAELAYAYTLTHPGTATIFYPDYYGATFYNSDSSQSFTMSGMKGWIDILLRIRKKFVSGNFYLLTKDGSPDYKPGDDKYASGDYSGYAPYLYIAQREGGTGTGNAGGCIVVLNKHSTDAIGAWVTVQGSGVGAQLLRDQTGNRAGTEEVFPDNRVFVSAAARSYSVWADANFDLSLPVELSSFEAIAGENEIQLRWETQVEINNVGFEVYRSASNANQFRMIADYRQYPELRGQIQSTLPTRYSFSDKLVVPEVTYTYKLADVDVDGRRTFHGPVSARILKGRGGLSQIEGEIPENYFLSQNYPNPFNPSTKIRFGIPRLANTGNRITLVIYNLLGERINSLIDARLEPGIYEVEWLAVNDKGQDLPAGIYYAHFQGDYFSHTIKMILLK